MKNPTTTATMQNASVQLPVNATAPPIGGPAVVIPGSVPAGTVVVEHRVHGVDIGGALASGGSAWEFIGPATIAITPAGFTPDQVGIAFTPGTVKGSYTLRVRRNGVRWLLRGALEIT